MKKSGSNYMNSTTSADARREQSKVSRKSPQTSLDSSSLHRKGSTNSPNICLNSSKDVPERLGRTTSSKMMRTLKKRTPSFKPEKPLVKKDCPDVLCDDLQVERATCSSTLKGCKFPDYLKLSRGGTESEGTSGVKVCSYSYCSLNGHHHALLPPLKSFVSARRQALKTERSVKVRCQSPEARPTRGSPNCAELIGRDEPATSNGEMCRDIDPRENLEQIGDLNSTERATAAHVHENFLIKSDDRFGRFFDEIYVDEVSQESFDEESLNDFLFESNKTPRIGPQSGNTTMCCNAMDGEEQNLKDESLPNEDATTEMGNQASYLSRGTVEEMTTWVDNATCKAIKRDQDHVENECNQAEYFSGVSTKDLTNAPYPGVNSSEAECNDVHEVNPRNMAMPETEDKSSIRATVKCQKSNQESDEPRHINPHGLHFLPLEPHPEPEKVNLRHQQLDARKNAEEWMVDYALREAVTRFSPARQRKVALLVQAFERILPTTKS